MVDTPVPNSISFESITGNATIQIVGAVLFGIALIHTFSAPSVSA